MTAARNVAAASATATAKASYTITLSGMHNCGNCWERIAYYYNGALVGNYTTTFTAYAGGTLYLQKGGYWTSTSCGKTKYRRHKIDFFVNGSKVIDNWYASTTADQQYTITTNVNANITLKADDHSDYDLYSVKNNVSDCDYSG